MAAKKRRKKVNEAAGERGGADLLLEIGTEELPAHFIQPALRALADSAERLLKEHRLAHGAVRTYGGPRRLVLAVEALSVRQAATVKEVIGPSKAVAYDPAGQPTKAAIGFAASQGVPVGALEVRRTPKGEYVFAVRQESGRPAAAVLVDILPGLIGGLSFPKSMRWNETGMRFARPIRWLLTLYGGKVVGIEIGGVKAGSRTFGHRFLGSAGSVEPPALPVKDLRTYMKALEGRGVIPDQEKRRAMILSQLTSLTRAARGHLHRDEELLEHAIYSVEYPHAILGEFEPSHLSLPKEVLMTAMKEHQGYFSVMGPDGGVLPKFIAVVNMKLPNMRLVREGNERVLAARLADAKFFFEEDRKSKLADRVEKLKSVTFHHKLGTLHQKTIRLMGLIVKLAEMLGDRDLGNTCRRAAELSKADLLTGMVGEFPTLQGVIGGEYAAHDGESEEVSRAIAEQYLPRSMDGELPRTLPGKILSLADRLDTIAAFFQVGLVPTGSEDPFALRRHATAIVRILIEGNLRTDLGKAVDHAVDIVAGDGFRHAPLHGNETRDRVIQFIFERLRYYGGTVHGLRDDVMEAVLKPAAAPSLSRGGALDLVDLLSRMKALQAMTMRPEFDPLMVGFKRAHRLIEKEEWARQDVAPTLFQHPTEAALYNVLNESNRLVPDSIARGDYGKALEALVPMRPAIDGFFVGVMVNTDDPRLRANRLSLLYAIDQLFLSFADFSQIVVQGT